MPTERLGRDKKVWKVQADKLAVLRPTPYRGSLRPQDHVVLTSERLENGKSLVLTNGHVRQSFAF